jgi:transcriptional regulator with XRE-family HTH domain
MKTNIRKLRTQKKLTLEEVGKKISLGKASLSKIENDQQNIYIDTAIQLADLFGVSLDELLGRDFNNPNKPVIKTVDFEFNDILHKLKSFSNNELMKLSGAIDLIIEERTGVKDRFDIDNSFKDIQKNKY